MFILLHIETTEVQKSTSQSLVHSSKAMHESEVESTGPHSSIPKEEEVEVEVEEEVEEEEEEEEEERFEIKG